MSNLTNFKIFENVGIRSADDKLIVMDSSAENIRLYSSSNNDNVDTLSIKSIINKTENSKLELSSVKNNTVKPILNIDNINEDCNITTNLNIAGNVNVINNVGIGKNGITDTYRLDINGKALATAFDTTSDDRLKINKELIQNSTENLMKLKPKKYEKKSDFNTNDYLEESGLIAQEMYYETPELRYLINIPTDANLNDENNTNWGSSPLAVNYIGLIPHLIKGFQEQNLIIENQKKTIDDLNCTIDKLKNSNSFDEFKEKI